MNSETTRFSFTTDKSDNVRELMTYVLNALKEKGYNPINQMVGYILSGDPSYITSYNNARTMISRIDRDDLVEEILKDYLRK